MFSLFQSMNRRGFLRISTPAALLAGAMAINLLAAADGDAPGAAVRQTTVQAPGGSRLRVEALDAHIVRVWLKPAGEFTRQPSLAHAGQRCSAIPG